MKKLLLLTLVAAWLFEPVFSQTVLINLGTTTVETSTLYTTNEAPWELKYGPGDSLWMTTKNGKVYRIDPNSGSPTLLLDYSANVYQSGEAGMLGMTFHPNFATNPYLYIAYCYTNGTNKERLSRFTYTGGALINELVLFDNIVANTNHDGSRLLILPDNTILMTTGDALNTANPQNTSSLNGKILRLNLDGTIPVDNPIAGNPVYTFGHRNPQGLMLHPNGRVYATEHGPNSNDEFQIIEAGRNYGWPNVLGFCDNDVPNETAFCTANNVMEPLSSWNPVPGITWAPSDLVWYSHPSIPEFLNSFLVAFLKTEKVRSIRISASGDAVLSEMDYFVNQWGRIRDITTGPDGSIYLATNINPYRVIKIRATNTTPVLLTNYGIACQQQAYAINWTTETEINNRQFKVYRSTNGVNFDLIATIPTKAVGGNSINALSYTFSDKPILSSTVSYKLESENKDGKIKDWGIVVPPCGSMGAAFSLLPNPASNTCVLTINGATELMHIRIVNGTGQVIYQNRATGTINLPVSKWSSGIYFISVTNSRNKMVYKNKLVVQ